MATSYIKLDQKARAVVILQEAIRCQYDNWRLWENYLLVTVDCGVFGEAIKAMHRLIDLRGKFNDAEVLDIISRAVIDNIKDAEGESSVKHRHQLLELFGRIHATGCPSAKVSRLHADVIMAGDEQTLEDVHRAISQLQRAVRAHLQTPAAQWRDCVQDILEDVLKLDETFQKYCSMENSAEAESLKDSLKYMFNSVQSRVESTLLDLTTGSDNEELKPTLSLAKQFEQVVQNYKK